MTTSDLSINLLVDQTPVEVFNAINHVRGWWSEEIEGNTEQPGDEFVYRYKDMHYSRQKIVEVIPDKKVVWLVTDSHLTFLIDKSEWTGTRISFEIFRQGTQTQLHFTHLGLVPGVECFDACTNGWNHYIQQSLLGLITKQKGNPDKKEIEASTNTETVHS